jgi:protein-tyrosine phosphatase
MIDLHCHVLPGLDDGPESLPEALEMCRVAARDGITVVVAMAHTLNGVYYNDGETILGGVQELREALRGEGLEIEILPGADVHVEPSVLAMIRDGRVMTINHTGRAVMLEFPDYFVADVMCRFLESLTREGVIPVISHPERCSQFRDRGLLQSMLERGAVIQVTAMSVTGGFGEEIQARSRRLLEEGLVHVIATDAHSPHRRPPVLSHAVTETAEIVGGEAARAMVWDNPGAILRGRRPSDCLPLGSGLGVKEPACDDASPMRG